MNRSVVGEENVETVGLATGRGRSVAAAAAAAAAGDTQAQETGVGLMSPQQQ